MRISIYSIILLTLFGLSTFTLSAQDQAAEEQRIEYRNSLSFTLTGFISRQLIIGYELNLNDHSTLRLSAAYKYANDADYFSYYNRLLFSYKDEYTVKKGFKVWAGYQYTIIPRMRLYVATDLFYGQNGYDSIVYKHCVGTDSDSYVTLQSLREHNMGLKTTVGKKFRILSGKQVGLDIDVFYGLGLEYRIKDQTILGKQAGICFITDNMQYYNPGIEETINQLIPVFDLGVKISMPFIQRSVSNEKATWH